MNKVYQLIPWYDNRKCYISADELPDWFSQGSVDSCVEVDKDKNLFETYELDYKIYHGKGSWSEFKSVVLIHENKKLKGLIEEYDISFSKGKIYPYLGKDPVLKSIGHFCELIQDFDGDDLFEKTKVIFAFR